MFLSRQSDDIQELAGHEFSDYGRLGQHDLFIVIPSFCSQGSLSCT
jgi:hypothetical protein